MRVLLAGGAGFIGSHMAEALVARGDDVIIVDSFVTGRRENLDHLASHPRVEVLDYDITAPLTSSYLEAVTGRADGRIDVVANLASPASPSDFLTMPLYILDTGAMGSRNLLTLAHEHGARYLFASTSEVYGDPLVHPQPEDYLGNVSSTGPRSCYDEAKRFGEAMAMGFHRAHGLEVRIARIFNTYGERMRPEDGRVVNTFIAQALRDEPLTVHGSGDQTRSFCHVSDMVAGLIAVMDGPMLGPVNLGNPSEVTIRALADMIIHLTGSSSLIRNQDMPPERDGDPVRRCPTIALARQHLGWVPTVSMEEGLRRMITHFEQHEGLARTFTTDGGSPDVSEWP
jgi:dTDP-glucose 4,6-dehydratase